KGAQMNFRRLVRAVLVLHGGEDAELGQTRRAANQLAAALVFLRAETVSGDNGRRHSRASCFGGLGWLFANSCIPQTARLFWPERACSCFRHRIAIRRPWKNS